MKKFNTPNPALQRLIVSLSPSALPDSTTGSACPKLVDHFLSGKQPIDTSEALLTQSAQIAQQAASGFGATTAVAGQPAVASSSVVLGSVCAEPQIEGRGSGLVMENFSSLFPGVM